MQAGQVLEAAAALCNTTRHAHPPGSASPQMHMHMHPIVQKFAFRMQYVIEWKCDAYCDCCLPVFTTFVQYTEEASKAIVVKLKHLGLKTMLHMKIHYNCQQLYGTGLRLVSLKLISFALNRCLL